MAGFNFSIKSFVGQRRPDLVINGHTYENGDFCSQCKPWSGGKKILAHFQARYYYVTGRRGRITFKEFLLCEEHGNKFIVKHKLVVNDKGEMDRGKNDFGG